MAQNPSTAVPASRPLRHWAARLSLLVACIATVATSKVASSPVSSEYTGETLRLTATSPRVTRQLVVRAFARRSSRTVGGDVSVEVIPTWRSSRPAPTDRPSLRLRVRYPEDGNKPDTTQVLDAPGVQGRPLLDGVFLGGGCKLDEDCEWNVLVELEVQGDIGEDVVEVDWKATANAEAFDTTEQPDDFRVEISES